MILKTTYHSEHITELFDKYGNSIPVDVVRVANDHRIKINPAIMNNDSGRIFKENNLYIIDINIFHPSTRQRFTIAHELGHYFLHKGEVDKASNGLTDNGIYRSGLPTRLEVEANEFAAKLLMPLNTIYKIIDTHNREEAGLLTPAILADQFHVSEMAMRIRLGIPTNE